jgi:hypothetical protein
MTVYMRDVVLPRLWEETSGTAPTYASYKDDVKLLLNK